DPAQQQFLLVNLERTDRGLHPLRMDANLTQMAHGYSKQLLNLHFFAHTSPISGTFGDRMNGNLAIANHYSQAAENLAGNPVAGIGSMYEYMYDDSAEACGHRLNILNPALTMVGINWLQGSIYGSISAQEFLTPAAWNPYVGSTPHSITPLVSILVSTPADGHTILQCQALVQDTMGIERISWFLDSLSNPLHTGASLTLDTRRLSPGKHTLLVYAVDGEQNYGSASYTIVI
ncbi:MAG: CAP domain-containing protein, partial [Ktedonobacteraceae bacterium]